jgi:hypothetical protein
LEKLFGAGSFGGSIDQLTHHITICASSGKLGLPFITWITALAFLGCWALVIFAVITYHLIIWDVIKHVKINISLFQMVLQDT